MNFTAAASYPLPTHDAWNVLDSSKLQEFLTCERQFFYRHILGWEREAPSNHLVFGEAWHRAMEHLLLNGYSLAHVQEAYEQHFLPYYRSVFPADTDELFAPKTPENALRALVAYTTAYADDLHRYEVLYTEISGTVPLTEETVLHFRLDSVMRDTMTKRIFSLEHKTGSSPWKWEMQWPLKFQIGTYTHCLYCLYDPIEVSGILVNGCFFKKVKDITKAFDFQRVPAFKTMPQMQVWLWNAVDLVHRLEYEFSRLADAKPDDDVLEAFPLRSESCTKYFGCPYHDFCCAWPNPLRECERVPLGFTQEFWDPRARQAKTVLDLGKDKP